MDCLSALRRKGLYSAPKFTFQWCDLAKGFVLSLRDIQRVPGEQEAEHEVSSTCLSKSHNTEAKQDLSLVKTISTHLFSLTDLITVDKEKLHFSIYIHTYTHAYAYIFFIAFLFSYQNRCFQTTQSSTSK